MTFFFAGHEATGLALSWAWYLLAQRPEVDARLVTELRGVLGSRPPRVSDLRQLPFTASVLKETLRLYPPAWAIGREALRDCLVGGYSVPAGTQLIMSQWITHRDPRYFEEPEKFLPERWSNGLSKHLPKYAYFPYGGGARVCIGKAFSEMETVLLLARIAQRFRVTLAPHQRVTLLPTFALVPKDGIRMVISER
jgi:cytochrome P450